MHSHCIAVWGQYSQGLRPPWAPALGIFAFLAPVASFLGLLTEALSRSSSGIPAEASWRHLSPSRLNTHYSSASSPHPSGMPISGSIKLQEPLAQGSWTVRWPPCLCWSTYPHPVPTPWRKTEQGELAFCLVLASCLYHCSKWLKASSLLVLCINWLLCHLTLSCQSLRAQWSSWELELFVMQCHPAPQSCSGICSSQGGLNISLHVVSLFFLA